MTPVALSIHTAIIIPTLCLLALAFPAQAQQTGYATLTPDPGNPSPAGAVLFSYTNANNILVSQAGVEASLPIRSGRIVVDQAGATTGTGIALVNPSARDTLVSLTLRTANGTEIDRGQFTLRAGEHRARFVSELFAGSPSSFFGSLTFESGEALAAIALRESRNVHGESMYTTLPVLNTDAPAGSERGVFPQIAVGGGYTTEVLLMNVNSQPMLGRIDFIGSNGQPLLVRHESNVVTNREYDIPPHGSHRAEFAGDAEVAVGYAVITPAPGSNAPSGTAVFRFSSHGGIVTEAGVGAVEPTTVARIYVDDIGASTGVAIANFGETPANLTFTLYDRWGFPESSIPQTLLPRSHEAKFVREIFQLNDGYTGLLEIRSNSPIAPIALKLTPNGRNHDVLTTLPVADMTRSAAGGILVFPHIAIGAGFDTRLILINTSTSSISTGQISFYHSNGSPLVLPMTGQSGSQFPYGIVPGGGRQLYPGDDARLARVSLIDPVSGRLTNELVINEGNTVRPRFEITDNRGRRRDDFDAVIQSVDRDIAEEDSSGGVRGKRAGFSTLALTAGGVVAAATVTVVTVDAAAGGFETTGVAQDSARRLYLASAQDHVVLRAEDLKRAPEIYAGMSRTPGFKDDLRQHSLFNRPSYLALQQANGSIYVSDGANNVIRRIQRASDRVETLAGSGTPGSADGPLRTASFQNPQGVALDSRGFLWVADSGNHTVRRINLVTGNVQTVAGRPGEPGFADGRGLEAQFNSPAGIAVESETAVQELLRLSRGEPPPPVRVIVADSRNGRIRRVTESGDVSPILENVPAAITAIDGLPATVSTTPEFASPAGIAIDPVGNIYVADSDLDSVRVLLRNGRVVSAAQPGTLKGPRGLAIAQNGRVIVAGRDLSAHELVYGEPRIASVTPNEISNRGEQLVTLKGSNFAPDSLVVVAGTEIQNPAITDTQTISFTSPRLPSGHATVTVFNRGGIAQIGITVTATPLSQLQAEFITTVAGGSTYAGEGAPATEVPVSPFGITVDSGGNVFFADQANWKVRRVDVRTGILTTVAGKGRGAGAGDDALAVAATLGSPSAVAFDAEGNLLIAADGGIRVLKAETATGQFSTVAGGEWGDSGDEEDALRAQFYHITGLAVDNDGTIFIADQESHRVRRVDGRTNIVTTIAGNGAPGNSGDNGPAAGAVLNLPSGVAIDIARRVLYIADYGNNRIRRVDLSTNTITSLAAVDVNGPPLDGPNAVAVDPAGNLFISDRNNSRIRKIDAVTGVMTTIAGSDSIGSEGDGGPATRASFNDPFGVAVDAAGNVFISDFYGSVVRRVDAASQIITTIAGNRLAWVSDENFYAIAATLRFPVGVTVDPSGNIFINDEGTQRIRKIDAASGRIATVAGGGDPEGDIGDGGLATDARLSTPRGRVAIDAEGNLYIADRYHYRVRRVDSRTNTITTIAGSDRDDSSGDGGQATAAGVLPDDLALDRRGNLYIAEEATRSVRRVNLSSPIITTVAGGGSLTGNVQNIPANSVSLGNALRIAVDSQDNLLIADFANGLVRKVDASTQLITTIAGGGSVYEEDRPATQVGLTPVAIDVDPAGNLLIVDLSYPLGIRRVSASTGRIKTIAGGVTTHDLGDNGPATTAFLSYPSGVATDAAGNLYIVDSDNGRIRAVKGPIP